MVDPVNLLFTKYLQQRFIQRPCRFETRPERFLHHDPLPTAPLLHTGQTTPPDISRDRLLRIRWRGQIIHHPHRDSVFLHQEHHPFPQLIGSLHGIKRLVEHFLQETIDVLPVYPLLAFQLFQHHADRQPKLFIAHLLSRSSQNNKTFRQHLPHVQLV